MNQREFTPQEWGRILRTESQHHCSPLDLSAVQVDLEVLSKQATRLVDMSLDIEKCLQVLARSVREQG